MFLLVLLMCFHSIGWGGEALQIADRVEDGAKWSEIRMNGRGLIIKNQEGAEIIMVDRFGGIYLQGEIYLNNKKVDSTALDGAEKISRVSRILTRVTLLNIALTIIIATAISVVGRKRRDGISKND